MTCQFICRNLQISKHLKLIKKQHELKCLAHTIAMHSNNHTKAHKHTYNHTCNEDHCSQCIYLYTMYIHIMLLGFVHMASFIAYSQKYVQRLRQTQPEECITVRKFHICSHKIALTNISSQNKLSQIATVTRPLSFTLCRSFKRPCTMSKV